MLSDPTHRDFIANYRVAMDVTMFGPNSSNLDRMGSPGMGPPRGSVRGSIVAKSPTSHLLSLQHRAVRTRIPGRRGQTVNGANPKPTKNTGNAGLVYTYTVQ